MGSILSSCCFYSMLRQDVGIYKMLHEGKSLVNPPNALPPLVTAKVLGGDLDDDLLSH